MANKLPTLDELRKLEQGTTAAPWTAVSDLPVYAVAAVGASGVTCDVVTSPRRQYARTSYGGTMESDARLIAAARNALPHLLAIAEAAHKYRFDERYMCDFFDALNAAAEEGLFGEAKQ